MKKIILLGGALALLSTTSCKEDYLDTFPTENVSVAPAKFKLNGLYIMLAESGTGGTSAHDDFGQKGYDIYSDLLSSDMVLAGTNYGWYTTMANYSGTNDYTNNINYKPWRFYYRLIKGANDIIDDLGGNDADTSTFTTEDRYVYAQAKALRAFGYFYLLQFYTTGYNPSTEAIPVYTSFKQIAQPKSTQAEVYDLIVKDLKKSIVDLEGFTGHKGHINKYVAKGLLAYAYAAQGKNAEAAQLSEDIINNSGYPITTREEAVYNPNTQSGGGFNNLQTPSWMWGLDITINNDYGLLTWWGQVDLFSYGYAWAGDAKTIDFGLYYSMRPDDIRKGQFALSKKYPVNKFFAPEREIGGQRNVVTDYVYMRADEFHLLAAEGYAKSGNEAKAKQLLKDYLMNRLDDVSYIDALSGLELQKEIYKNTRLEFWGEGKSYLAMKRNKATVTRGANHLTHAGESFSYDDDKLTLDIPQQEITDNPNF